MPPKTDFDKLLSAFLDVANNELKETKNELSKFETVIEELKGEIKDLKEEIKTVKQKNTDLTDTVSNLVTENIDIQNVNKSLNNRVQLFHGLIAQLNEKLRSQEEQIIDLKARSMRENIVFDGINEDQNENWQQTKEKLHDFLEKTLNIENPEEIQIDRVHRFGKNSNGPRPIVAKISHQQSRDIIFDRAKTHLDKRDRNKPKYNVKEQLPPEIIERRKRLWPKFLEAKANRANTVRWSMDKVYINGTCHTATDEYSDIDPTHLENDIDIKHTPHSTVNGSTFMGHCAQINSKDDVPAMMATLLQDRSLASATHNIYAYRIATRTGFHEGQKDDGEHGASFKLLQLLRQKKLQNCMVVVTRWYGGQHLGPHRFTCIEASADEALKLLNAE
jgi:putative IMPACT (imprinted ancient) family translation regulator